MIHGRRSYCGHGQGQRGGGRELVLVAAVRVVVLVRLAVAVQRLLFELLLSAALRER